MPPERLPSLSLSPGGGGDEELRQHWFRSIAPFYDSIPLPSAIRPTHHQYHAGQFLFLDTTFGAQAFVRDAAWRRRDDAVDHVVLQTFLKGRNLVSNGSTDFVQEPGVVTAVHLGQDVTATCTDAEVLTLILPRDWMREHFPQLGEARGVLTGASPMAARLFGDFMLSLRRNIPLASPADLPLLTQTLLGMLGALMVSGDVASSESSRGVFMALNRFIDDNLADTELDAAALCAHFRLSRATLFRLFKAQGGVQSHIQRRRLMACFRALSDPRQFHRRIYLVALDCGLANPSHLTALFRQHFGMTPREVRDSARHHADRGVRPPLPVAESGQSDAEMMQAWAQALGRA